MAIEQYWRCPCDDCWLSQGYKSSHKAIDLGWLTKYGANRPVKAAKSGVVAAAGTDSHGGVYVVLQHDDGNYRWFSAYWHFVKGSTKVKKGQTVTQGQVLGTRGNTGISSGVHLHFAIAKAPKGTSYTYSVLERYAVNPLPLIYKVEGQHISIDGIKMMPPEIVEPKPVARDEAKHQIEILITNLRIRVDGTTKAAVYCMANKGIYNVLEVKEANGYVWACIEPNRWIATKEGEWTKNYPSKSKEDKIKELENKIIELTNQLNEARKQAAQAKEYQKTLEAAKQELQKTQEKLNNIKSIVA